MAAGRKAPRCYLASPLGFTEGGQRYYSEVYLPAISRVCEAVDPWALTSKAEIAAASKIGRLRELWLDVGRRNVDAIASCQLLVAYLEGQEPDSGTVAELGYAAALGKVCFGLRSDFRESGETGMAVNLQVEMFIVASGGAMASSLADLLEQLEMASAQFA